MQYEIYFSSLKNGFNDCGSSGFLLDLKNLENDNTPSKSQNFVIKKSPQHCMKPGKVGRPQVHFLKFW